MIGKKNITILFCLILNIACFAKELPSTIKDYFPSKIGYSWTYNSSENKVCEIRSIKNIQTDSKTGNTLYLMENLYPGIGSTSDLLLVDDKSITAVASKNVLGQYKENIKPYPVLLTLPNEHGLYNDSGDAVVYETYMGECSFDQKRYKDCIVVEEKIINGGVIFRTKKSYFAKNIGLVYVTLKTRNSSESVYLKLKETNFSYKDKSNSDCNAENTQTSVKDIQSLIDMVKIPKQNFEILKTEVTQKLYFSVMNENPSNFKADDKPVHNINLYDAIYFCNKLSTLCGLSPCYKVNGSTDVSKWNYVPHHDVLIAGEIMCDTKANGYRLPTNDEWEYSANGGKTFAYSGSDNPDDVAWYNQENEGPHTVATKKSNDYGLYDMSGNVNEWCWKFLTEEDPDSRRSVARGGSWVYSFLIPLFVNSSVDISYGASYRSDELGFRICRSLQ